MSNPELVEEDKTKKLIDEKQLTMPRTEVVEQPIFREGNKEASPVKEQTDKDSALSASFIPQNWKAFVVLAISLALIVLIP